MKLVGYVRELTRYPVKSMAGVPAQSAALGLHGLQGDRRFAFRRLNDNGTGFPWLSASRLPGLLLYRPDSVDLDAEEPARVRTPEGEHLELRGEALCAGVAAKFGSGLEMMKLKHGIFDDAHLSVIDLATVSALCREANVPVDTRRFRANVVVDAVATEPFLEDEWVGGRLRFGDGDEGPVVAVTSRDERCMMINLNPDAATQDPAVMKAAVRMNGNHAGVYAAVARPGRIAVGQPVHFIPQA